MSEALVPERLKSRIKMMQEQPIGVYHLALETTIGAYYLRLLVVKNPVTDEVKFYRMGSADAEGR